MSARSDPAERAVVRHAIQRGYLTSAQVAKVIASLDGQRSSDGQPTPLLQVLRKHYLRPEHVAELLEVYRRASAKATRAAWAAATLPPSAAPPASAPPSAPPCAGVASSQVSSAPGAGASTGLGTPGFAGRIGPYQVERELARGGMGVVFIARHTELGRRVALKVMLPSVQPDPVLIERFVTEAQAVAKLSHPNIVALHDVGREGSCPFLAMELVEGESLEAKIVREGHLGLGEAVSITKALAEAMHYAHSRAILHRDLKPANVLIDPEGRPKITDFGLARDVSEERERLTKTGQTLGTPSFMPPEQADGRIRAIDQRADVYALGATLYAMLAGRPPFQGESALNVIAKLLTQDPEPLRRLRPEVPADLETIVLKCMEKVPDHRYRTALALAADLDRYRSKMPIRARRKTLGVRAQRFVTRHKVVCALFALGVVGTSTLTLIALKGIREAQLGDQKVASQDTPTYWIERGRARLRERAYTRAIKSLRKASNLDPTLAAPHALIGEARSGQGDTAEAIVAFTRAIELSRATPWLEGSLLRRRAEAHHASGETDAAKADAESALALLRGASAADGDMSASQRRGELLAALELNADLLELTREFSASVEAIAEAIAIEPTAHRLLLRRAGLLQKSARPGDLEQAIFDTTQVLQSEPENTEARLTRALLRCRAGDYDGGMKDCEAVLDLGDGQARTQSALVQANLVMGLVRLRGRWSARAIDNFDRAIELTGDVGPKAAEAYALRALTRVLVLQVKREADEVQPDVEAALEKDPGCAIAYVVQAKLDLAYGDAATLAERREAAKAALGKAIELDPQCGFAYATRIKLYAGLKQYDLALESAEKALSLNSGDIEALDERSKVYKATGELTKAIADCTKVIDSWPLLRTIRRRAWLYAETDQHAEAILDYDRALQSFRISGRGGKTTSSQATLFFQRARSRIAIGDDPGALVDLDAVVSSGKQDAAPAYFYRGELLMRQGKLVEARESFTRYLQRARRLELPSASRLQSAEQWIRELDERLAKGE